LIEKDGSPQSFRKGKTVWVGKWLGCTIDHSGC
jgi:hypothetical protein